MRTKPQYIIIKLYVIHIVLKEHLVLIFLVLGVLLLIFFLYLIFFPGNVTKMIIYEIKILRQNFLCYQVSARASCGSSGPLRALNRNDLHRTEYGSVPYSIEETVFICVRVPVYDGDMHLSSEEILTFHNRSRVFKGK